MAQAMQHISFVKAFDTCVGHAANAEPGKYYKDGESTPSLIVAADGTSSGKYGPYNAKGTAELIAEFNLKRK